MNKHPLLFVSHLASGWYKQSLDCVLLLMLVFALQNMMNSLLPQVFITFL